MHSKGEVGFDLSFSFSIFSSIEIHRQHRKYFYHIDYGKYHIA